MNTELHGMIPDMSNEDYHRGPGISKSHLDRISADNGGTPLHYWAAYIDPDREPQQQTPAMRMGTLIHTAVLEPDTLATRTMLMPEDAPTRPTSRQRDAKKPSESTLEAIAWWDRFEATRAGREIITPDEHKALIRIQDRVRNHPIAGRLLADGEAEKSYFAKTAVRIIDHDTGEVTETEELVKCRPDWVTSNGVMVDLKSTESASPSAFGRSVVNYRYFVQPPWYGDIFNTLYGEPPAAFVFIAVEKAWPHAVGVYFSTADQIDMGRDQYRKDLRLIAECKANNRWPDFGSVEALPLALPGWFKPTI
jgi:hypothetical protein